MKHNDEDATGDRAPSRAEYLRDRFQRDGKWVNEGGHEIHLTLETALEKVKAYQEAFDALNDEALKTKRAMKEASEAHSRAMQKLNGQADTLDVHKMILAEKMGIPS